MALTHTNIYTAVFQMNNADKKKYMAEWNRRHPGKTDRWISDIKPYIHPTYMLFCAPVTNPLLSLFKVISDLNKFDMPIINQYAPILECEQCGLSVVYLAHQRVIDKEICLKCFEIWVS